MSEDVSFFVWVGFVCFCLAIGCFWLAWLWLSLFARISQGSEGFSGARFPSAGRKTRKEGISSFDWARRVLWFASLSLFARVSEGPEGFSGARFPSAGRKTRKKGISSEPLWISWNFFRCFPVCSNSLHYDILIKCTIAFLGGYFVPKGQIILKKLGSCNII